MDFNINITQYYSILLILLIQYYSILLTLKTVLFQFNMCQYSSILQATSNIHQYSSILPEQLGDGQVHRDSDWLSHWLAGCPAGGRMMTCICKPRSSNFVQNFVQYIPAMLYYNFSVLLVLLTWMLDRLHYITRSIALICTVYKTCAINSDGILFTFSSCSLHCNQLNKSRTLQAGSLPSCGVDGPWWLEELASCARPTPLVAPFPFQVKGRWVRIQEVGFTGERVCIQEAGGCSL